MALSVVVPTLNARDDLEGCLDALARDAPSAEIIVVNGPSADGTTGMVKERSDIDVLVDTADRTISAARNAGLEQASGDEIAFVDHTQKVVAGWRAAVADGLTGAAAVTGPTHTQLAAGVETETVESREIAGHSITYVNPGNVAYRAAAIRRMDGFDEYLPIGGSRDLAHRLALDGSTVRWDPDMRVNEELGADGGRRELDWGWKYRSLAYRLGKNFGPKPTVLRRVVSHAGSDAMSQLRAVVAGNRRLSNWLGTGRTVVQNTVRGFRDGLAARRDDGAPRRNPNGLSSRSDRAVSVYDWR